MHCPVNRPIAAHFPSAGSQFSCFAKDFGEAVCEAIESGTLLAVWKRAADDQHEMLGGEQGIDKPVEACEEG